MKDAASIGPTDRHRLITEWYTAYKASLAGYLLRVLGDEEQAADILHDTFMRAFAALDPHKPPEQPRAWLHRIATNLALNALRRRNRLRWLPLSGNERAPDMESQVVLGQTLRRCVAQLKPQDAEALLLYEHAGLTCIEIAALTGEPPLNVRVRLFRARERFRRLYEKE